MALILADTDVLIEYLRGNLPVADLVAGYIQTDSLHTSCISCFELLVGAREGKRGDGVRRLVESVPVVALDREAAAVAAGVKQKLEEGGEAIGMADCLIAGIAIANNLELLTRNRKHFAKVRGLRLVSAEPTQ